MMPGVTAAQDYSTGVTIAQDYSTSVSADGVSASACHDALCDSYSTLFNWCVS